MFVLLLCHIGVFKGRVILGIYQSILLVALVAEIYILTLSLTTVQELKSAYVNVGAGETNVPMSYFETLMSTRFNTFFFGAQSKCLGKLIES